MKRGRISNTPKQQRSPTVEFLHRHAAALSNVGATLFQRGDAVAAMNVLQQSVQTLMAAEKNGPDFFISEVKQEEMELFLQNLLEKAQRELAAKEVSKPSTPVRENGTHHPVTETNTKPTITSPTGSRSSLPVITKSIPGLFRPTTRFKVAKRPGDAIILTLSFADPFFIAVNGKSDSGPLAKKQRVKTQQEAEEQQAEVSSEQTSDATLFNMGLIHVKWGSLDSAIQLFQLSLSVSVQKGETTPKLLNPIALAALSNIGQICCQLGRIEEAVSFFSDAMARGNAALALLHDREEANTPPVSPGGLQALDPALLSLHRILARVLMNLGCAKFCACAYGEAQRACEDALRLLHDQLTEMDRATLWYNLGLVHEFQQNRIQALEYYDKFLVVAYDVVGTEHPSVADAQFRIGCVFYDIGQLHKALPPLLRALSIRLNNNGEHHAAVAEVYHQIGKVLQAREDYEDALSALAKALTIQRRIFQQGGDCEVWLQLAETLLNVGRLHHAQGNIYQSLQTYREVVSISVGIFGEHHPQIARMHVIVANLELELGHVSQSLSNFTEAARIELGQGHPVEAASKVQNRMARVALLFHPAAAAA